MSRLENPRYKVLLSGALRIHALRPQDAGIFQCFASNQAGEIHTYTYLDVTSESGVGARGAGGVVPAGDPAPITFLWAALVQLTAPWFLVKGSCPSSEEPQFSPVASAQSAESCGKALLDIRRARLEVNSPISHCKAILVKRKKKLILQYFYLSFIFVL